MELLINDGDNIEVSYITDLNRVRLRITEPDAHLTADALLQLDDIRVLIAALKSQAAYIRRIP